MAVPQYSVILKEKRLDAFYSRLNSKKEHCARDKKLSHLRKRTKEFINAQDKQTSPAEKK
jgi:hypothetical protein